MSEYNLVKVRQLDSEISGYITGIVGSLFGNLLTGYVGGSGDFGSNVIYASGYNQTLYGQLTFNSNPNVPYSGTTGQAPSQRYVNDLFNAVNSGYNTISGSSFVYTTGDQIIYGNKAFYNSYIQANFIAASGYSNSYGINLNNTTLVDSGAVVSVDWSNRVLNGNWTINGASPILSNTNQSIGGNKTFTAGVYINDATGNTNPVSYQQFLTILDNTGQNLYALFSNSLTGNFSGFAGVSSLNGSVGNIFSQGRGTVTIWQQGNIFNVSGAMPTGANLNSGYFATNVISIPTGISAITIPFSNIFNEVPAVVYQVGYTGGDIYYEHQLQNVTTSGFSVAYSQTITELGHSLNYFAVDATGLVTLLNGQQGLLGPYLIPSGNWQTGVTYGYLEFINYGGVSYAATTGHISTTGTNPTGVSGVNYWQLLASGQPGPAGATFGYVGVWNSSSTYSSGQAVNYNGSTYGATGTSFNNIPPSPPWTTISAQGAPGASMFYDGHYNSGVIYQSGDSVSHNKGLYVYTGSAPISGNVLNPNSINNPWSQLLDRAFKFNSGYSATQIYYKNDLVYIDSGYASPVSLEFINVSDIPLLSLYPSGYYNIFTDCNAQTGYNLFLLSTGLKDEYHPYYGSGNGTGFQVNNISINQSGFGWGELLLIRGQTYYFENPNSGVDLIITSNPTGGTYSGQIISGITTGTTCTYVDQSGFSPQVYTQSITSGTLIFAPDSLTPSNLYFQSTFYPCMGWKIKVVDESPWEVFSSGITGPNGSTGPSGNIGLPGLAFSWKGNWNIGMGYNSGDSVYYNGSSYGTNNSVIATTPNNSPWFLIAQSGASGQNGYGLGFNWQGNWSNTTNYSGNSMVFFNGSSYASETISSGQQPDIYTMVWKVVASSGSSGLIGPQGTGGLAFTWQGNYSNVTNYNSGDSVFYNGSSYGTQSGISGAYPPSSPWQLIAQGGGNIFNWRGIWDGGFTYYSGNAVYFSGSSYATLSTSTNYQPNLGGPWFIVAQQGSQGATGVGVMGPPGSGGLAFAWRGNWNSGEVYFPYDSTFSNGSSYGTLTQISGDPNWGIPPEASALWFPIAQQGSAGLAFNWNGNWNSGNLYSPNSAVYYGGRSYGTTGYVASGLAAPSPTGINWFVVADRGATTYNQTFYIDNISFGYAIREVFNNNMTAITGIALGLALPSIITGSQLSGSIYRRDTGNNKYNLYNFVIPTGSGFIVTGGLNFGISGLDRIGIDISGEILGSYSGLCVGIFGTGT